MDILVCIKQVPASNKVEVDPVTGVLLRNGADSKMNPYDLYALETALKIREEVGGTISVISMGPWSIIIRPKIWWSRCTGNKLYDRTGNQEDGRF